MNLTFSRCASAFSQRSFARRPGRWHVSESVGCFKSPSGKGYICPDL